MKVLTRAVRQEKEIKGIHIQKEEIKLSLFADDMTLYIENSTGSIKKLLELINSVKLQDTKSVHKNLLYFYTLTMKFQKEIKKTIPFIVASKRIKYLGINLTKNLKHLYTETKYTHAHMHTQWNTTHP